MAEVIRLVSRLDVFDFSLNINVLLHKFDECYLDAYVYVRVY